MAPWISRPIAILQTLGTAVAVFGAVRLVAPHAIKALEPIPALAKMTLTFHPAHIIRASAVLPADQPAVSGNPGQHISTLRRYVAQDRRKMLP